MDPVSLSALCRPRSLPIAGAMILVASLVIIAGAASAAVTPAVSGGSIDDPNAWAPHQKALTTEGEGFLVWESNRTGNWRIFFQNLDGSGVKQISSDEEGIEHAAPHISPDGRHVAYLAYRGNDNAYNRRNNGNRAQLRLMRLDGGESRVLAEHARAYFENRAAVWLDDRNLVFIDHEGYTTRLDIQSGSTRRISHQGRDTFGYLPDPTLRFATTGFPNFATFDKESGRIQTRDTLRGCQPYFSRDGRWGYWISGAGGPIRRFDLQSGAQTNILEKDDPRLPRGRAYLYFPMVSPCQRLLAFSASANQHDHFRGNYDIFIAPIDPQTLMLTGAPVRHTFSDSTDRYPDVFLADYPLGRHVVKAPHRLEFATPDGQHASWEFSDGLTLRGARVTRVFITPQRYVIEARQGERTLRGVVEVLPASPPKIEAAVLSNDRTISIHFNEPVTVAPRSRATLESGIGIEAMIVEADGRRLDLKLSRPLRATDTLTIEGITDRAWRPNALPRTELGIEPVTWPVTRDGLVFLWQHASAANLAPDTRGDGQRSFEIDRGGQAVFDAVGRLLLQGGHADFRDAGAIISESIRRSNAFSIELTFRAANRTARGPARIITLSNGASDRNFTIGQERDQLVMRLRTTSTNSNGMPDIRLGQVTPGVDQHLLVTWRDGELNAWLDGEHVQRVSRNGTLANWADYALRLGDELNGDRAWPGWIDRIAIHSRAMSSDEANIAFVASRADRSRLPEPDRIIIQARVRAVSDQPTLERIQPYREALRLDEVEVERVIDGRLTAQRLRIARWAILDGQTLDRPRIGQRLTLAIEPFEAHTQLIATYLQDTLEDDFDVPRFVVIAPDAGNP
ncbi:MAG: hypothetical protein JJU36_15020 [Phycisphaeraceae bacterium]|nr:hypothetical protein [Phycisphaeraceae bacterium]